MQVRQLLEEDDAVSPVIGVILMVAITVILAAVIASFVLGLGGSQQQTPQASFSWEYNNVTNSDVGEGLAEVSHDGGDSIKQNELVFRGTGFVNPFDDAGTGSGNPFGADRAQITSAGSNWDGANSSGSIGDTSAVVGGDTIGIGASSDYELSLVWEPAEGDTSATLSEQTGPDA
ncbi:type IV pilin [Halorientalis pallida]|uniref:Type IV pilin n=1 Tax=Halorientalis pallida TaxID=2479928 RepID=A0A498KQK0_9EURY|nr:type IV pilin N-terminal domain-containing protein [Halorientalis pallida]RXK46235.1 type IV pilin [Halorientalis pallida]